MSTAHGIAARSSESTRNTVAVVLAGSGAKSAPSAAGVFVLPARTQRGLQRTNDEPENHQGQGNAEAERLREVMRKAIAVLHAAAKV